MATTLDRPRARVAVADLPLRAAPDAEADIVYLVPRGWQVRILDRDETAPDGWTRIAVPACVDDDCQLNPAGWVVDADLAFDDRWRPLADWRRGILAGYDHDGVFAYRIADDGSFTRWRSACSVAACPDQPAGEPVCRYDGERASDGRCVLEGRLHRYRDLVRGVIDDRFPDFDSVMLFVDQAGELCAFNGFPWDETTRLCDRTGRYADVGDDPETALRAVAADRRRSVAFTVADVLNLRAGPAPDAAVSARLPRGSVVERQDEAGPEGWVAVVVEHCADAPSDGCRSGDRGWAADAFLAYEDRLTPIAAWRPGRVAAYAGDTAFGVDVAADGSAVLWQSCGEYTEGRICPETGRLLRYRDLVVALPDGPAHFRILEIDGAGRLCLPDLGPFFEYGPRCAG